MGGRRNTGLVPLAALLGALLCASPRAAHAQADELAVQVESWLAAGVETTGAHGKIVALGERGEHALTTVFEREAAPRYVRLRALSELGAFGTETSALYLAGLVHRARFPDASLGELHPARSALALRRALEGLVETARSLGTQLAVDDVSWCLSHADAHVRRVASDVLATLDDRSAEAALQSHLTVERSRMVRGSVTRALAVRAARPVTGRSAR